MKKSIIKSIICFFLAVVVIGCASNEGSENATTNSAKKAKNSNASKLLNPKDFNSKIEALNNELLVDLRSHGELHSVGPIKGAQNLDFNSGRFQSAIPQLDKNQPMMLYCAGGNRSSQAAKLLTDAGFKEVYDLQGGVNAWKNAGFRVAAHSH